MKEITRIHIAKTAYDIEITAKKELEQYIAALERYAEDPSVLEDIEIRMTELLEENGTTRDDVITVSDVTSLRKRLGEPQDFAEDSDVATLPVDINAKPRRRLYRNQDSAVLGGVLSGIATYFGINPLWTRLAFIVLLIPSFGTMVILYVILWIVLPPARTAAEKLELEGKTVTLAAIKDRSARIAEGVSANHTAQTVQKVLLFGLGVLFSIVAVGALIATVFGGGSLLFGLGITDNSLYADTLLDMEWYYMAALGLFVLSGLLFTALNIVLAVAAFRRIFTWRMGVTTVAIIVAGIVAFSVGIGMLMYGQWRAEESFRTSMVTTPEELPVNFADTKKLTIDVSKSPSYGAPMVIYIVSNEKPYAEVSHVKGKAVQFNVTQKGDTSTVVVEHTSDWRWQPDVPIRIYGPALDELNVHGGGVKYTNEKKQSQLKLVSTGNAALYVEGTFEAVIARTSGNSSIDLSDTAVRALDATTDSGTIEAGVVRTLAAMQPEACSQSAETSGENTITVEGVSSGTVIHNGTERSVKTNDSIGTPCGIVTIGEEEQSHENNRYN